MTRLVAVPDVPPSCAYPGCERPVDESDYHGGQHKKYCANPKHNRARAWLERDRQKKADAAAAEKAANARPVTDGITAFALLVQRWEAAASDHAEIAAAGAECLAVLTDPASIAYQADSVNRAATMRTEQAAALRAEAEHKLSVAERERDEARAAAEEATAAAEAAEAVRDKTLAEARAAIADAKQQMMDSQAEQDQLFRDCQRQLAEMRDQLEKANTRCALAEQKHQAAVKVAERRVTEADELRGEKEDLRAQMQKRIDELQDQLLTEARKRR